ncbi:uncharacterized protein ACNS7B_020479 [Menidia menidia]
MAATLNRAAPPQPGPGEGNPGPHPPRQQEPGPPGSGQEPGPPPSSSSSSSSSHPLFARPVFYVQAPPPPPFLQYQWPLPFSYSPFGGFPGMGYGMVLPPPPFAPPPFLESPAYILPHPHLQPMDYRRLLPPPGTLPQPPPPPADPALKGTPSAPRSRPTPPPHLLFQGAWPPAGSDSGRGTAPNSPNSPGPNFHKRGFKEPPPGTESVGSEGVQLEKPLGGPDPDPFPHCSMWMEGSPEGVLPVSNSSPERRISIPDLLMSWEGGTPQAKMKIAHLGKPLEGSGSGSRSSPESPQTFKILRLPPVVGEPMENRSGSVGPSPTSTDSSPDGETMESFPNKTPPGCCNPGRQLEESVWSVESLVPFVPSREWILQNQVFGGEVKEVSEEAENLEYPSKTDRFRAGRDRRKTFRLPSFESVLSDLNELKLKPDEENGVPDVPGLELNQTPTPPSSSPSSEGRRGESPPVSGPQSSDPEPAHSLSSPPGEKRVPQGSPAKGRLVDCGVQCSEPEERRCVCGETTGRKQPIRHPDVKNSGDVVGKKKNGQWRNRDRQNQPVHNGYSKPGKPKGGNVRNPRH